MTRTMGDSTSLAAIPLTVNIAAFYLNGRYAVTAADVARRFPNSKYGWCRIDVNGELADRAQMLDVENGDATPATANLWVQSWHKLGRPGLPAVYVNRGNEQTVINACASGGQVLGEQYGLVISTLDGTIIKPAKGITGCQDRGAQLTGGDWDMSLIYDASFCQPVVPPRPPVVVSYAQAQDALAGIIKGAAVLTAFTAAHKS